MICQDPLEGFFVKFVADKVCFFRGRYGILDAKGMKTVEYGVFTSEKLEIAEAVHWALVFYHDEDRAVMGAELYNGADEAKTLAAVCERDLRAGRTAYAYEEPSGKRRTNDPHGVCARLGQPLSYDRQGLRKIDDIHPSEPYELPTVSEAGVKRCLLLWRMGCSYRCADDVMIFTMVTGKIEYVFSVWPEKTDLYCGASLNVPTDEGMLGEEQYFRLRNFGDNTASFCGFYSHLGDDAEWKKPAACCESGSCVTTEQGIYWPLKRHTDDEIVLNGCGGDEYVYRRDGQKSEYFR